MPEKNNGEKAWLRWALRALLVGSIAMATTLVTTALNRLTDEVAVLRCEVQGLQVASIEARALLASRVTRVETKLNLDP